MTRLEEEFSLLKESFPCAVLAPQRDSVEISDFMLPDRIYQVPRVRLKIPLTPAYPDAAPDNFYVSPALRLIDGSSLNNYSESHRDGEVWGQFSWHQKAWRAGATVDGGDNLLTFLNTVRKRLEEGR